MMLNKALLSASVSGPSLPAIGASYEGGFIAGYISHTANGVATHGLIVAPRSSGAAGSPYPNTTFFQCKTTDTSTAGTTSLFNGAANSANMNNADHPAGQYCEGLTIGGYSDWYLPALYELDIAYQNLKPTTTGNNTSWGINPYSVPERTVNRTSGTPARTSVAAFQSGGAEAFVDGDHWTSSESTADPDRAWRINFLEGGQGATIKTAGNYLRAFRKFAL